MKFSEIKYQRPIYEDFKNKFYIVLEKLKSAKDFVEFDQELKNINKLRNHIETMEAVAKINSDGDTKNKEYVKESIFWDEYSPLFKKINMDFYKIILNSKFKEDIKNKYGEQFIDLINCEIESFSDDIIKYLQEENKLCTEYTKLLASAKIDFKGDYRNLPGMFAFMMDENRNIREDANKKICEFFEKNEIKFDELFDKLIKVRNTMAKKMGYNSFVELGYKRMKRTCYNSQMVEVLRNEIKQKLVPFVTEIYKEQSKRIGVEKISNIDESLEFLDGNASPKGDEKYILNCGKQMYRELSKETGEFFDFMMKNELFDVKSKEGKSIGGYCINLPEYKMPFIFSNFNQTADDIDVLTHEAGHAFQLYMSSWIDMSELQFPTLDSCEIHSMSMEFITYPWMELFFKEDTEKYKKYHFDSALKFLPYGCIVDEFQHIIYENINLTAEERKTVWRNLEKKYLPHRIYENSEILEKGCWWYRQGHIFKNPFYYIDYVLAQLCALQFYLKLKKDETVAWDDFLEICKIGGTKSFLEIVEIGNLKNPFKEDFLGDIIEDLKIYRV